MAVNSLCFPWRMLLIERRRCWSRQGPFLCRPRFISSRINNRSIVALSVHVHSVPTTPNNRCCYCTQQPRCWMVTMLIQHGADNKTRKELLIVYDEPLHEFLTFFLRKLKVESVHPLNNISAIVFSSVPIGSVFPYLIRLTPDILFVKGRSPVENRVNGCFFFFWSHMFTSVKSITCPSFPRWSKSVCSSYTVTS